MRKSLITTAVLGALAAPAFVFAADAAPAPDYTLSYNVGLYSQYIFRGLTQTNHGSALQGGVDFTHSSGFYLGAWASNISWLRDNGSSSYMNSGGSLETDWYGGFRTEIAKSGVGIDIGVLQYYYPGHRNKTLDKVNTTEVYGALNYGWMQAKISTVVSKEAWGFGSISDSANGGSGNDARGTYYAELNATVPVGDLIGGDLLSGVTAIAHVARQEFPDNNSGASYTDYKLGVQKAFSNGVNVGGYWTKATTTDGQNGAWIYDNKNIGNSTGTLYVQKTF